MKKITFAFALIASLFFTKNATASHVSGGDITYTCIGSNQYEITLKLYRDCSGTTMQTTASVSFTNTCGLLNPNNLTLTLRDPNNLNLVCSSLCNTEVSQLCPSQAPNSSCNGGSLPGMQEYIYKGIVTLTGQCNSWTIAYNLCCRNTTVNVTGRPSYHVETTMNSLNDPCNNSAFFTAQPIPFVCVNNPVSYSLGVIDPDGDSLQYTLISAKSNPTTLVTYNGGFSGAVPITGITINSVSGQINFTPTLIGNFIVVVQVEEFDFFGVSLGTVTRDFQFVVQNCSNTPPDPLGGVISNFSGTATQTGPYSIQMCAGDNFSFDAIYTDPNSADILSLTTNITSVLTGSSFSSSGTNPITGSFSWTAPTGPGLTFSFTVIINDGTCPLPGINSFIYTVVVGTGVFAGPDQTICTGNTTQLQSLNATNPVWTSIAGDPINVGTNISCDSCANPVITPSQTTTYVVTSDSVVGLCNLTDTITITVLNATGPNIADAVICPGPGNFASINVGAGYTNYTWNPACCVGQFANIFNPGTYIISVDTLVCTLTDTFVVSLAPAPTATITGFDTVCIGGTTTLTLPSNFSSYLWNPGNQTTNSITVGVGTYFATITDTAGCVGSSDTVTVVNSIPQATINGITQICLGDETLLSVTPVFSSYQWSNGATTPTSNFPVGPMSVIVTNSIGCNDTVNAVVPSFPVPVATITGADSICPGDIANLAVTPNFASYLWFNNDTNSTSTSTGGNVSVIVTDNNGCKDTANATVSFFPVPSANFSINPADLGQPGQNIQFTDLSTANINAWFWTFGDGGSSTVQNPIYVYTTQGTFPITLTVQNTNGCSNQVTIDYLVVSDLIIPNVFTPNGDGMNDLLVFKNLEFFENELKVFNRWGREIFSQTNYNNNWDGDDVSYGTYFYILEVKMVTGGTETFKGTITILK